MRRFDSPNPGGDYDDESDLTSNNTTMDRVIARADTSNTDYKSKSFNILPPNSKGQGVIMIKNNDEIE